MNIRIATSGRACIGVLTVILGSAGCASIDPHLERQIASEAARLSPDVRDDEAVVAATGRIAAGETTAPEAVELPADATIESFVTVALERNPAIRRAVREIERLGFRVPQVTSLPDPMIDFMPPTGDMTETAAGMLDAGIGISQEVPFPGKLRRRGEAAEQDVRIAFARLADMRLQTGVDVANAYYDHYLATVSAEITRESQQLLRTLRDVAAARFRVGEATQQDVLRAEVEEYAVSAELIETEQRRASAAARLNGLMNRPVDAALPAHVAFELEAVAWRLDEALRFATKANPRLARVREEARQRMIEIELARLEAYPDLQLGFSYNFIGPGMSPVADGSDNWAIPLGINLPIWRQRLRAKVLEANARALSSVEQYDEIRNLVAVGIHDALARIDVQYRRARILRDLIAPRARQAVDVSTAAYRVGDVEFDAIVENWRSWLAYTVDYHRALARLEQRFTELHMLVGARIPRTPAVGGAGEAS